MKSNDKARTVKVDHSLCICGHKFVDHGVPGTTCHEQPWLPEDPTPCLCSQFDPQEPEAGSVGVDLATGPDKQVQTTIER